MSKIIIVGHKSIDLVSIEEVLKPLGFINPECSDINDKSPAEIDRIIQSITHSDAVVPKVWDGLALNLMLANIDKSVWGWSNSDAINTLSYWKNIDDHFYFILSYDKPAIALLDEKSSTDLESVLMDWFEYNQKVLQFYIENKDRCLLINQEQFDLTKSEAITLLSHNIKEFSYQKIEKNLTVDNSNLIEVQSNNIVYKEMMLEKYILENIIQQYPMIVDLYEKLQAVSDLPLCDNIDLLSPVLAWQSLEKMKANFLSEKVTLVDEVCKLQEQTLVVEELLKRLEENELAHKIEIQRLMVEKANSEHETFELLKQMHIVQEEFENFYLQSIKTEEIKAQGSYGAADRIKSQLSYRIGATMIKNSRSFVGVLFMPFSLFSTYRLYKKELKNKPKLPPIYSYQDSYDVPRIQGHLSYQLGNYFIKNIKKPWKWFVMPWAIKNITKNFRAKKA